MKHVLTILFSLLLMLGHGVPASSAPVAAGERCTPAGVSCCSKCACCVSPAGAPSVPLRESVPAPVSSDRLELSSSLPPVLWAEPLDNRPFALAVSFRSSSSQPVPLFQRHCLLLI
jgi:hypothetical protein